MSRSPDILASGDFDCPDCGEQRAYQLLARSRGRRFPFAALILGRQTRPVLECEVCGSGFAPATARRAGQPIVAMALHDAVTDMLAGMALSDGTVHEAERAMIDRVLEALAIPSGPLNDRLSAWAAAPPAEPEMLARLAAAAPYLDGKARALVLEAAYHLANVDSHFHTREEAFLRQVAVALAIRPGQYEIILDLAGADERLFSALTEYLRVIEEKSGPDDPGLVFVR